MTDRRPSIPMQVSRFTLGLALAAAAGWMALRTVDFSNIPPLQPHLVALMAVAVTGSLAMTAVLFWVVTLSFDTRSPVPLWRMTLLITASGLLNYLPLRVGMVGRGVYLFFKHALPATHYMMSLMVVLAVSLWVALVVAVPLGLWPLWGWWVSAGGLAVGALLTPTIARRLLMRRTVASWSWILLKAIDLMVTAIRLRLAFAVFGQAIDWREALLVASASMLMGLVALTPNALGMREWAVGLVTAWMLPVAVGVGAMATLLDRAMEAVVFTALGVPSVMILKGEPGGSVEKPT